MQRTFTFSIAIAMCLQFAGPVIAQTTGDDLPAAENWWDRVGAQFFSDEGLTQMRPEYEIRAHWTALSADDQAAVLARCAEISGSGSGTATSQQEGSNTGLDIKGSAGADHANQTATDGAPIRQQEATVDESGVQPDKADKTSITGTSGGDEVQKPAEGTIGYTGLAGGSPDDGTFAPVCTLVAGL